MSRGAFVGYSFTAIFIWLIFLSISFHTPMHSDDYSYAMKGLSLQAHFDHYMGWSGRAVADYVSSFLLSLDSRLARAVLNAIGATLLLILVSLIPSVCRGYTSQNTFILILVFLLYWLSNTNLGQTTFWIVGAANYLWTCLLILAFLFYLIKEFRSKDIRFRIGTFALALLASCTNENTGIIPFFVVLLLLFKGRRATRPYRQKYVIYAIGALAGYLILVLSPGNAARAAHFSAWYDISLASRAIIHFTERVPALLSSLWMFFGAFSAYAIFQRAAHGGKQEYFYTKNDIENNEFAACFFLLSVLTVAIMVAAPDYHPRVGNGTLVFLLLAFSFYISADGTQYRLSRITTIGIAAVLLPLFIFSYYRILVAYNAAFEQDKIRRQVIAAQKDRGLDEFSIPDFYFRPLWKSSDKFDTYHNECAYGDYFNVKRIETNPVYFDYSLIRRAHAVEIESQSLADGMGLHNVYVADTGIILEADKQIELDPLSKGLRFFVHAYRHVDEPFTNYDFVPKATRIGDTFWYYAELNTRIYNEIHFGLFDQNGRFSDLRIELKH